MSEVDLSHLRRGYAEELRVSAPVRTNSAVVEAFATVAREQFFGPGPWRIIPPEAMNAAYMTADADSHWLYHNVLVCIDETRDLNSGEPTLWARLFDQLDLRLGDRVMQIGAGTGYYSAVLAEIVGRKGRVVAVEYDAELAGRAKMNLVEWPQIEVVHGDGTRHDPGETDAVVVFAGATHPAAVWLDCLADEGRLLMPLTTASGGGFLLRAIRNGFEFEAQSLGWCGFFPCIGGRNQKAAGRLRRALRLLDDQPIPVQALFRGEPSESAKDRMWYTGPGFWLSR